MSSLDRALDNLFGINWQFDPIDLTENSGTVLANSSTWSQYEQHLSLFLDRPLTYEDIQREQHEILRRSCLHSNLAHFEELAARAQNFFHELTVAGRQELLARHANLERWEAPGSTVKVHFKPPKLPANPLHTFDEYVDSLEVPQSFGARFLWKLAAWRTPKAFGYSDTSLRNLFLQPLWFNIAPKPAKRDTFLEELEQSWSCAVNERPIKLICEAARQVGRVELPALSSTNPIKQEETELRYGMTDDRNFYWGGKKPLKFGPVQGPLLKLALDNYKQGRRSNKAEIEKTVWNKLPQCHSTISGHLSKIGKALQNENIPLELSFSDGLMMLSYMGSGQNPLL